MAITPLPPAPLPSDSTAEFNTKAFALVGALNGFVTETNALAVGVDADRVDAEQAVVDAQAEVTLAEAQVALAEGFADDAETAATASASAANYKGEWSTLTGALAIPASVSHNGSVWVLTQSLADVTSNEPGVDSPNFWLIVTLPAAGAEGNILTSNGTNWTSTAPSISGTLQAIAYGALSDGSPVVINANGTVSVAQGGLPVVFESATTQVISSTYDSTNNKVVIVYSDAGNSSFGTAIVGTVSGASISFGTAVVFESANTASISSTYDSTNNKVVIAYQDAGNSSFGTAIVGTVSGTSISFGTAVVFESAATQVISSTYDSTNNKVVISYQDVGNSSYGTAIVGTVSGASISFGTAVVFASASTTNISATYDSINNKVVIAYVVSSTLNSIVGTVSGTSISFGTAVSLGATVALSTSTTYDSTNGKVVIAYRVTGTTFGNVSIGTVSGTSISFGTAVVFESASTTSISLTYDSTNNKVVISYVDNGNSNFGTVISGTVSGTSISFGTAVVFESASTGSISSTYNSTNNKVVIAYQDGGNSNYGTAITFDGFFNGITSLTSENFIGISNGAYANAATATVQIVGSIDDAQTGLTPGQSYFVRTTGGLSLTADTPSVFAGTAVSATKLIVKG